MGQIVALSMLMQLVGQVDVIIQVRGGHHEEPGPLGERDMMGPGA